MIEEEEDLYTLITKFKSNVKAPFMDDLIAELNNALKINDPVLLAFDVFNVCINFPQERKLHSEVLLTFYGTGQSSTCQSNNSVAPAVLNSIIDDKTIKSFFEAFKSSAAREEKKERNNEIKMLVQLRKLNATHIDEYKDEHSVKLDFSFHHSF